MNLNQFTQALTAQHPQAEVTRTCEVGATVKTGLTVTFTPGGQMYHYTGSFYAIAQAIGLIEKWYVLESGMVVDQATSEQEANEKMIDKAAQASRMAAEWGNGTIGEFTIRQVK